MLTERGLYLCLLPFLVTSNLKSLKHIFILLIYFYLIIKNKIKQKRELFIFSKFSQKLYFFWRKVNEKKSKKNFITEEFKSRVTLVFQFSEQTKLLDSLCIKIFSFCYGNNFVNIFFDIYQNTNIIFHKISKILLYSQ